MNTPQDQLPNQTLGRGPSDDEEVGLAIELDFPTPFRKAVGLLSSEFVLISRLIEEAMRPVGILSTVAGVTTPEFAAWRVAVASRADAWPALQRVAQAVSSFGRVRLFWWDTAEFCWRSTDNDQRPFEYYCQAKFVDEALAKVKRRMEGQSPDKEGGAHA